MTSAPLQSLRAQMAAISEVARLAELRVLAVQAERLARLDQQILRLKYAEARKGAAADQAPKAIRPRVVQALPIPPEPPKQPTASKKSAPKKLQSTVPAGKQPTRKQRKRKARIKEAV